MNTDKPLGATLVALGVAGIAVTLQIKVRTFTDDPGPQLFPLMACAILLICGVGLLLVPQPAGGGEATSTGRFSRGATMGGLMVFYAFALWLVGFYVATLVSVYAFYHIIAGAKKRRIWVGAVYAACVTGGVHLLFSTFLNAFMPHGILI